MMAFPIAFPILFGVAFAITYAFLLFTNLVSGTVNEYKQRIVLPIINLGLLQ